MIRISIPKWEKYNPRSDRANYSWFRFQNDFFHDQRLFGLTDAQVILFQFLLCEASKRNKPEFEINAQYFATFRRTTMSKILSDIRELEKRGVIVTADSRLNDGEEPALLPATYDTNERDVTYERTNTVCTVAKLAPLPTQIDSPENLLKIIPEETQAQWPKLYPDPEFLEREAIKTIQWCKINPRKTPKSIKGWVRFYSGWLERGWERYRKSIPSSGPAPAFESLTDHFARREREGGASA